MATPTNLPAVAVSGDILTAAYVNNLRGAFRVLQVISTEFSTEFVRSVNTFADTGITLNITTQSNTSKVFVIATIPCQKATGNTESACNLKLMRGATDLKTTNLINYTNSNLELRTVFTDNFLDSPATLGTLTYKYQLSNNANAASAATCKGSVPATITLMEISA